MNRRIVPSRLILSGCALLAAGISLSPAQNAGATPTVLAAFRMSEYFGAAWPDQPIEFHYAGPKPPAASTRLIGPAGREIPYQWISSCDGSGKDPKDGKDEKDGCILIRSYLPANANYTWTLQSGVAPAATVTNPVRLTQTGSNYEITNGLTGVRIVSPAGNPKPWNRAPIQGVLLPGGVWTGAGASPNMLYTESHNGGGSVGAPLTTPLYTATGYSLTVVDSGPLKVVMKVSYTFSKPAYRYANTLLGTAGNGHYTALITLYANANSVLIDEDSDMQFSYYLPFYSELHPDQARFRGHDSLDSAGSSNPVCGYEEPLAVHEATAGSPIVITAGGNMSNGQRVIVGGIQGIATANGDYFIKTAGYPEGHFGLFSDARLTMPVTGAGRYSGGGIVKGAYRGAEAPVRADAYLDIGYSRDRAASYRCDAHNYRKLMTNYAPAAHSAGYYLMAYNSSGGPASPVFGIYTGRPSKQIYAAIGPSMPGLYSSDKHWITGQKDAGIEVENLLRGPDGRVAALIHRNWAIWTGTRADVLATTAHQPLVTEQCSLDGINLSRLYTYQLEYPDPPGGWKWMYLSPKGAGQLIAGVRNGSAECGSVDCYFKLLSSSETSVWGRNLLALWRGGNSAAVQKALDSAIGLARYLSVSLAVGEGHFSPRIGYYELGLQTSPESAVLNAILMDGSTTPEQKKIAKAALALFGSVFWDNDWFPIDNDSGEGYGLTNQVQQYLQYRAQSVASAPSQPFLAAHLAQALTYPIADFKQYFSPTGAASASTHYQNAFFQPLILNYMAFSKSGVLSMSDPKWVAYANWELSTQTPPEPRFGNLRKGYSNGDGNTEANVRTGMLATAMYSVNPTVAGNLMWAWLQSNAPTRLTEDSQFVTTLAVIDPSVPAIPPHLASTNVPGYHAVERFGFGTTNETALWFIDGGYYSPGGHRHNDDGQVSIYADGAPLSIDWNANLYSPATPGRFMHNSVVWDSELKRPWNVDNASLTEGGLLKNPTNTEFASFPSSTVAVGTFVADGGTQWTRSVRTMAFNSSFPVIYVKDTFAGPGAAAGKTLTWNMMAAGPVNTPAGLVNPVPRFSAGCQRVPGQLPSGGEVHDLAAGLQRFAFTGVNWPKHASGGIDWDLYLLPGDASQKFFIGDWGHGCQSSRESSEFQAANARAFAETQHILRVHAGSSFATILLPYPKRSPVTHAVEQKPCGIEIVQNGDTTCFSDAAAQYSRATGLKVLTVYDNSEQSAFGLRVAGGPQEVALQSGRVVWTLSGNQAGRRMLTMPGTWHADQQVAQSGQTYTVDFPGGLQTKPVTIVFSSNPR